MLTLTTTTLAGKINKELDLGLKSAMVCQGDYLLGKLKTKHKKVKLPALSVFRTNVQTNRTRGNVTARAASGVIIGASATTRTKLRTLPILASYDISLFMKDSFEREQIENKLLWMMEDPELHRLPLPVKVGEEEFDIPGTIAPSSAAGLALTTARQEETSDEESLFRLDFSLEVHTSLIKLKDEPLITKIVYKMIDNEIILEEAEITEDTY